MARPSATWTMPRRTIWCGGSRVMSSSSKDHAAAARPQQARQGQQRGALAGAVGADQGGDFTLVEMQGDALDGLDVAVGHRQVLNPQEDAHGLPSRPRLAVGPQAEGRRVIGYPRGRGRLR